MNALTNTLLGIGGSANQKLFGLDNETDGSFASILGAALGSSKDSRSPVQKALDKLAERFPGLSVKAGEVGDGVEAAKSYFTKDKKTADQAAVSPSVLAGMIGNTDLAKMVEDAIAGFLDKGSDSNLMNIQGAASVQRSVTITITTVRYGEYHRSDNGDVLAATDLKTDFQERLAELIKKFFGVANEAVSDAEGEETNTGKEDGTEAAAASRDDKTGGLPWNAVSTASMWSLQFYYSATYVSSFSGMDKASEGGDAALSYESWKYSASYSSFSTQQLMSKIVPNALLGLLGDSGTGNSGSGSSGTGMTSLASFLGSMLAGTGMETTGVRSSDSGFLIGLRQQRAMMASLMGLLQGGAKQIAGDQAAEQTPAAEAIAESTAPAEALAAV